MISISASSSGKLAAQLLGHRRELPAQEEVPGLEDHAARQGVLGDLLDVHLEEQALAQVDAGDPRRIEGAHDGERLLDLLQGVAALLGLPHRQDLFRRRHQEAVRVEVADDQLDDLALAGGDLRHVELPEEVVVEVGLAGEAVLDRRLLALLHHRRGAGALPVVAEVGVEVDVLHRLRVVDPVAVDRRLGGRGLLRLRRLVLGDVPGLLEDRVLHQLLREKRVELHAGHLQKLDRLLQRRRHHQLLRQLQGKFLL